jgi:hypothetical protein
MQKEIAMAQSQKPEIQIEKKSLGKIDFDVVSASGRP